LDEKLSKFMLSNELAELSPWRGLIAARFEKANC
jgi:hypothetical protein